MKNITVDEIMEATDKEYLFGWKDLKPIIEKRSAYDKKWLFFLTSMRRVGKSTTIARYFLADFIVNHNRFLYIRRSDDLLYSTMHAFFDDAVKIINDAHLGFEIAEFNCETLKGKITYSILINWDDEDYTVEEYTDAGDKVDLTEKQREELVKKQNKERTQDCGNALSLKQYEKAKSAGYSGKGIKHFVYDEFMAEQAVDYLGSKDNNCVEYDDIMSIYMSVDSDVGKPFLNDTEVFCLGNKAHDFNPILLKCGVNIYLAQSPEAKIISPKYEEWVYVEIEGNDKFKEMQKNSRAFRAMKHDSRMQDFIFDNESKDAEVISSMIGERPKKCEDYSNVILGGKKYGIFYRASDGLVYVSGRQTSKHNEDTEALDIESYNNGDAVRICKTWKMSVTLNIIYERFLCKKVMFSDKNTQYKFLQYLDFIPK